MTLNNCLNYSVQSTIQHAENSLFLVTVYELGDNSLWSPNIIYASVLSVRRISGHKEEKMGTNSVPPESRCLALIELYPEKPQASLYVVETSTVRRYV